MSEAGTVPSRLTPCPPGAACQGGARLGGLLPLPPRAAKQAHSPHVKQAHSPHVKRSLELRSAPGSHWADGAVVVPTLRPRDAQPQARAGPRQACGVAEALALGQRPLLPKVLGPLWTWSALREAVLLQARADRALQRLSGGSTPVM